MKLGFAIALGFAFLAQISALEGRQDSGDKGDEDLRKGASDGKGWAKEIIAEYKWIISLGVVLVLVFGLGCGVVKIMGKNEDCGDEQEEKIYLVSRRIKLPVSESFGTVEKVQLSKDFGPRRKEKEPQEIYKETLIRKLNLSKV